MLSVKVFKEPVSAVTWVIVMKEMYVVDYDLPQDKGRRQFYRHLNRILKDCNWKRSSQSVIVVDGFSAACDILQLARAYNAHCVNVYKAVSRS